MAYDLASPVQATSLSVVRSIATNPPLHPSTPTDLPATPLVLYIARVPGSRDVFLTPMKPRDKIVTAEDVQSSLYYVHVNCSEDYSEPRRGPSSANADASQLLSLPERNIDRKPMLPMRPSAPLTPPPASTDSLPTPQPQSPRARSNQIERKPVGSHRDQAAPFRQQKLDLPVLPRRPLPSPPAEDTSDHQSLHASNVHLLRRAEHSGDNDPYNRPYNPGSTPRDPTTSPEPGTLTLIRRDPSTNEQWNVALIHDPPIQEVSSTALLNPSLAKRTKRGGTPLYLDVANPTYAQFIDQDRTHTRISSSSSASSDSDPIPQSIFRRRLFMPGSRLSEHSYRQEASNGSRDSLRRCQDTTGRKTMRSSVDGSEAPTIAGEAYSRNRCYTFFSPWDGRCEFSTGTTGKTLRCRHYLPAHHASVVREVSELRFNLPTSSTKTAKVLSEKRSSYFHRLHGRSEHVDDTPTFVIGDDGRLDLSLGQERAGGGFGGKQAKLGKLIIQPEGLKMLDLLIAANIGLWWRAYERT